MTRLAPESPVLLVLEDSDDDFYFFQRGLQKSGTPVNVYRVTNGVEALAYLNGENEFSDRSRFPLPTRILCDIKMPVMNGFEFLRAFREMPQAQHCPVCFFTNSVDPADFTRALTEGARACYPKPSGIREWPALISQVIA